MVATNYVKGRRAEYRAIKELEAQGYTCCRSAGSHGIFDVQCFDINHHKLIQVKSLSTKSGSAPSFIKELQKLTEVKKIVPPGTSIEFWVLRGTKWINKITI